MRGVRAGLLLLCLAARAFAQPSPTDQAPTPTPAPAPAPAPEAPDFAHATELYNAATQAMTDGHYDDATRDFLAAFEITKDPVLFFKIGSAYEKAGKCSEALGYYERYLGDAKPEDSFVTLTKQHIDACKATLAAKPEPAAGEKPAEPAAPAAPAPSVNKDRAWLFVGGALAFVTAGAVLAYSTASVEKDVEDLYISQNGQPPEWNAKTQARLDDLDSQGRRYQYLTWTSFGLAAACGIGATIFFVRASHEVSVAPIVTPKETGVSATLRF